MSAPQEDVKVLELSHRVHTALLPYSNIVLAVQDAAYFKYVACVVASLVVVFVVFL